MNDLISREAAIEAIIKSKELTPGFMGMELYTEEDALDAINSVPSAQQWIPFKKQKPKDKQKVLVWFEYFRFGEYQCPYQTYGLMTYPYTDFVNGRNGWSDLRIIAWQPLPEPYVEVEE